MQSHRVEIESQWGNRTEERIMCCSIEAVNGLICALQTRAMIISSAACNKHLVKVLLLHDALWYGDLQDRFHNNSFPARAFLYISSQSVYNHESRLRRTSITNESGEIALFSLPSMLHQSRHKESFSKSFLFPLTCSNHMPPGSACKTYLLPFSTHFDP